MVRSLLLAVALTQSPPAAAPQQPPVVIGDEVQLKKPNNGTAEKPNPNRPLRVGVVPSLGQGADKESAALATFLAKELGTKVQPELFENHDAEANALVAGRIDVAWMPPYQGFNAKLGGAQPISKLVRKGATTYRSVFFVRADSKIQKLGDVHGATVGWVEANSATGHLFPLAMVAREHLTPSQLFKDERYLGTHDAVCKAVWDKKVELGATLADEAGADGKMVIDGCKHSLGANAAKLRVVSVSEPVPNDVFSVRQGLDPALVTKLQGVLAALPSSPAGKAVLKDDLKADGVTNFQPGDFDGVQHALEAAADVEGK